MVAIHLIGLVCSVLSADVLGAEVATVFGVLNGIGLVVALSERRDARLRAEADKSRREYADRLAADAERKDRAEREARQQEARDRAAEFEREMADLFGDEFEGDDEPFDAEALAEAHRELDSAFGPGFAAGK